MTDLDAKLTFESFVGGPANRLAFAAAKRAADSPGTSYNPIFVYSASGLGKSHMLIAIAHHAGKLDTVGEVEYMTLETYLDAADMALERDKDNMKDFVKAMSDEDEGIRYWAIVGLHLLKKSAKPATETIEKALTDDSHEVRIMAAWTMVTLGEKEKGIACLRKLLFKGCSDHRLLHNTIDWMGEPAFPLVKEYMKTKRAKGKKGKYEISILGKVAEVNGL